MTLAPIPAPSSSPAAQNAFSHNRQLQVVIPGGDDSVHYALRRSDWTRIRRHIAACARTTSPLRDALLVLVGAFVPQVLTIVNMVAGDVRGLTLVINIAAAALFGIGAIVCWWAQRTIGRQLASNRTMLEDDLNDIEKTFHAT